MAEENKKKKGGLFHKGNILDVTLGKDKDGKDAVVAVPEEKTTPTILEQIAERLKEK